MRPTIVSTTPHSIIRRTSLREPCESSELPSRPDTWNHASKCVYMESCVQVEPDKGERVDGGGMPEGPSSSLFDGHPGLRETPERASEHVVVSLVGVVEQS